MMDKLKESMAFQSQALQMRSKRQSVISSNISNAETPGYKAVDVDFSKALSEATGTKVSPMSAPEGAARLRPTVSTAGVVKTHQAHLSGRPVDNTEFSRNVKFRRGDTASLDGNSVNIERERAAFAENTVKFEASLRSLNGRIKTLKAAMKD